MIRNYKIYYKVLMTPQKNVLIKENISLIIIFIFVPTIVRPPIPIFIERMPRLSIYRMSPISYYSTTLWLFFPRTYISRTRRMPPRTVTAMLPIVRVSSPPRFIVAIIVIFVVAVRGSSI